MVCITYLVFPPVISFLTTYFLIKKWIPLAKKLGFIGKDMNKYEEPEVAEGGGIFVTLGITFGFLSYIFIKTYLGLKTHLLEILVSLIILLLSSYLGLFDDLLGWKKGLRPWQKPLLTLPISLPLIVLKIGETKITLPFFGTIDLGEIYTFLLIPIGIMGGANGFNMIAGYNGLEAIMGILLFLGLLIKSFILGKYYLSYLSLIVIASILAFFIFNKYPAKIFPGNSFTYAIGSLFVAFVILGNMEKFGLFLFSLYFLELFLFLRGLKNGIYKENFGIPDKNNCLKEPYERVYSITHLAIKILRKIKGCVREYEIVIFIALMQLFILILSLNV